MTNLFSLRMSMYINTQAPSFVLFCAFENGSIIKFLEAVLHEDKYSWNYPLVSWPKISGGGEEERGVVSMYDLDVCLYPINFLETFLPAKCQHQLM